MAEKKFFVDINLQRNKLVNAVIGTNNSFGSASAKGGSIGFNQSSSRLEYFNGSTIQEIANLSDISAVTGGLILQGGYDADTNTPNITDGTALKGFFWVVTVAGSFLGESVQIGDSIIAKIDEAGATLSDWLILQGNVVIATDTVDGISRLATQTEANDGTEGGAVVITPATLQGKIDAQITPEISSKLPLAGGTMSGTIDMGINNIYNVANLSGNNVSVNSIESNENTWIDLNSDLDAQSTKTIINLPAPTSGGDATKKTYVDGAASTAQANAESYADSLAPNYDAAGASVNALQDANTYTDTEIAATMFTSSYSASSWLYNLENGYFLDVEHNLSVLYPIVQVYDELQSCIAEFDPRPMNDNTIRIFSNILPVANVTVNVRK